MVEVDNKLTELVGVGSFICLEKRGVNGNSIFLYYFPSFLR